jgi:TonB family protein
LLYPCSVTGLAFAEATTPVLPRHNGSTLLVAAVVHMLLFFAVTHVKTRPVRVHSAGSPTAGIAAYVAGPVGVMPATIAAPRPEPKKTALKTEVVKRVRQEEQSDAGQAVGSAGVVGAGQPGAAGPVRLGAGGNVTLVKRVQPVYPAVMQSARVTGQVVLDAVINPDGTIGDITVLKSTNEAFAQSAIQAVKQWRYTAIGYQGILTVSVNFTLT